MIEPLVRRLAPAMLALLALSAVAFILPRVAGGDPAVALYGVEASVEERARINESLGLDRPLPEQYLRWVAAATRGDFGRSTRTGQPAIESVAERLPATVVLALAAALLGTILGTCAGVASAHYAGRLLGRVITSLAAAATAAPGFWIGLLLIFVFAYTLRWLPFGGASTLFSSARIDPANLILPALALSLRESGRVALLVRNGVLDALRQPYTRVARAKGLSPTAVTLRHALPNALGPVASSLGLSLSYLLGGAIAVETVFGWPGLGRLMAEAAASRDVVVLAVGVLAAGVASVVAGFTADLASLLVDPKARGGEAIEVD